MGEDVDQVGGRSTSDGAPDPDGDDIGANLLRESARERLFGTRRSKTAVGRFDVRRRLGSGGMGSVYAAYDGDLQREVAVKVLHQEAQAEGSDGRARLLREAQAMARLSHPNVIPIHEVGTHGDSVYIAMELVDGPTLTKWLEERPRSQAEILDIFRQAADGLSAAHAAGLVHRDFKPDNVLIGSEGRVRVADFGLARPPRSAGDTFESIPTPTEGVPLLDSPLTRTGAVMGTPAYMAPEQHRGESAGVAADQFSFCVALWEALCSQRPFTGPTIRELAFAANAGHIDEPPKDRPIAPWLRRILERGLRVDPGDRHPSMLAVREALDADPAFRRRRTMLVAAAGLTLAAAVVGGYWAAGRAPACASVEDKLADVWGEARRGDLRERYRDPSVPAMEGAWRAIEEMLGAPADAWGEAWKTVCAREPSLEREASLRCLEVQRVRLVGRSEMYLNADPKAVAGRVRPLYADLWRPEECVNDEIARALPTPPDDPELRVRVDDLRRRIARNRASGGVLDPSEGLAEAVEFAAEADALGYAPVLAEARLAEAFAAIEAGKIEDAHAASEAALLAAEAGRADIEAVEALLFLRRLVLHNKKDPHQAAKLMRRAEAAVERAGEPLEARLQLQRAQALALRVGSDTARAEAALLELQAEFEEGTDASHWIRLLVLEDLRVLTFDRGEHQQALAYAEQAQALLESVLGPSHPGLGPSLNWLSHIQMAMGRYKEALETVERGVVILQTAAKPEGSLYEGELHAKAGEALALMGRLEQAQARLELADEMVTRLGGEAHFRALTVLERLALVLRARGDHAGAGRVWKRSVASAASRSGVDETLPIAGQLDAAVMQGDVDEARRLRQALRDAALEQGASPRPLMLWALAAGIAEDPECATAERMAGDTGPKDTGPYVALCTASAAAAAGRHAEAAATLSPVLESLLAATAEFLIDVEGPRIRALGGGEPL